VTALAISAGGGRVAVGLANGEVRLYRPHESPTGIAAKAHGGPVVALVFSSDGSLVLSGGEDGFVRSFNAQSLTDPRGLAVGEPVSQIAVAGGSGFALVLGEDGQVVMVSLTSFSRSGVPWPHGKCRSVAVAADGLRYAALTRPGRLVVGSVGAASPVLDREVGDVVAAISLSPGCQSVLLLAPGGVWRIPLPVRHGVAAMRAPCDLADLAAPFEATDILMLGHSRSGRPMALVDSGVWMHE
jgi:WD40 repeat protein